MLSCLNGALEFYRTTGDRQIPRRLPQRLAGHRRITASTSPAPPAISELFHDDFDLPNVANVGETCVTVTWLQFNAQLLRLTGEARLPISSSKSS